MVGVTVILLFAYAAISNGQGSVSFDEVGLFSTENHCHLSWSYNRSAPNGPFCWHTLKNYTKCGDFPQSPINIETDKVKNDNNFEPKYDNVAKTLIGKLENTGYVPLFNITNLEDSYHLRNVPSRPKKAFKLEQFHMHFHEKRGNGSEHRINCQGHDGELHFVHKEIGLPKDATHKNFVVLAIFVTRANGTTDNNLRPFFDNLKEVTQCGTKKKISIFGLPFLEKLGELYTYEGSLTTPGCNTGVTWLIKKKPINVKESDFQNLMLLKWDKEETTIGLHGNVRPTFPMDPPLVLANFEEENEKNNNNYVNDNHDSSDDDDENRHACTNWLKKPECLSMDSP